MIGFWDLKKITMEPSDIPYIMTLDGEWCGEWKLSEDIHNYPSALSPDDIMSRMWDKDTHLMPEWQSINFNIYGDHRDQKP